MRRAITNGSFVKLAPPRASDAGAARRVNLLILLKPPQTAAWRPNFGRRSPVATRFHLPWRSSEGEAPSAGHTRGSLKRTTNHIRRATPGAVERKLGSTDVDGKWQLDSPTAANDEKTQTVTGYKRRAPIDGCRRRTGQCQQSAGGGSAQRRQGERESSGSQPVDQGEQPVPKVEEEEAAAAKPRSGTGTASSSASKLRRKGEDMCPGTIEAQSSAVWRGI